MIKDKNPEIKRIGLRKYRVKETYQYTNWTYVKANSEEEAITLLEQGAGKEDPLEIITEEWVDTDWSTLECVD